MRKSKPCPAGSDKQQMKHEMKEKKLIRKEKINVKRMEKMHKNMGKK